ncbi:MAG: hypothetical protein HRT70_02430 [Flavobacteriaceae bacterium]|nr:hypothetical protein [Flavobacteriaceae bacterium]
MLLIHGASIYITSTTSLIDPINYTLNRNGIYVIILSVLFMLFFLVGVLLTILSISRREEKNYQFYVNIFGYPLYLVFQLGIYFYRMSIYQP